MDAFKAASADLFKALPAAVKPYASTPLMHCPVLTAVVVVSLVGVVVYYVAFVLIPGWRIDYYLSKLPTVKGKVPVLGQALRLAGPAPWRKMAQWSLNPEVIPSGNKQKDPKAKSRLVTFDVAGMRVIYVNDPRLLRRVLLTHQRVYRKALKAAYKHFMCLLGTGLVSSEDDQWKKGRLLLSHALRIDILEDIPDMTMTAVQRIMKKLDGVGKNTPFVDLNEEFRHMTLQVIGESALSLTPDETDRIFPTLYLPIVHECNKRVWAPWRAFMPFLKGSRERDHCLRELNRVLSEIISSRWTTRHDAKNTDKPDILALCMSQIDAISPKVVKELRDDVKTMLLAGHETSAALLTWATYECIRHEDICAHVVEEARHLFDPKRCKEVTQTAYGPRGVPTADDVRQLTWVPAVLRETLRRHSVVPLVMRYASEDDIWKAEDTGLEKDILIPAGCTIAPGIEGVHNNPDVWEQPEKFDPTRFIDAEIANNTNLLNVAVKPTFSKVIDPFAFIPFINGPRNCLGQHLSLMETQVALAYLLLNWDLKLYRDPAHPGDDATWKDEVGRHHDYIIPQVPHDGLKVVGNLREKL